MFEQHRCGLWKRPNRKFSCREKKSQIKINIYLLYFAGHDGETGSRWKQVSTQKSHSDKLNNITKLFFFFFLSVEGDFCTHSVDIPDVSGRRNSQDAKTFRTTLFAYIQLLVSWSSAHIFPMSKRPSKSTNGVCSTLNWLHQTNRGLISLWCTPNIYQRK